MNIERIKIVNHVNEEVLKKITGEAESRCLRPTLGLDDRFFVGSLSASEDETKAQYEARRRIKQIGIDVLVKKDQINKIKLRYSPKLSFFYRVQPTLNEQRDYFLDKFNQDNVQFLQSFPELKTFVANNPPCSSFSSEIAPIFAKINLDNFSIEYAPETKRWEGWFTNQSTEQVERLKAEARKQADFYSIIRDEVKLSDLENEKSWQTFFKENKPEDFELEWSFDLYIQQASFDEDNIRISFALVNTAPATERGDENRANEIFDAKILLEVERGEIVPFQMKEFDIDYKYARKVEAIGKNCCTETLVPGKAIVTTPIPQFKQFRLKPQVRGKEPAFKELSEDPIPVLKSIRDEMEKACSLFEKDSKAYFEDNGLPLTDQAVKQIEREKEDFLQEMSRFSAGINTLSHNDDVLKAFRLMNKSFIKKGSGFLSWRLFQIVFIISLLPDLAKKYHDEIECPTYDMVDLLYFPTGGGKTEAFLGVIIFQLFLDRLNGKQVGTSAIVKYPLRLLSIQQMQRIADVVGRAELIRRGDEKASKGEMFSVGYLVGRESTPNEVTKDFAASLKNESQDDLDKNYLIVEKCPFCGKHGVKIKFIEKEHRLAHYCENCTEGILPIYIVDREIFRYLPSIIISTIDKFASIGRQKNFRNILGTIRARCKYHGFTSTLHCTEAVYDGVCSPDESVEKVNLHNVAPSLFVQDELHLLSESLGIFDSHYETFLDFYIRNFSGKGTKVKIIAATATICNYKKQIQHLYMKSAVRFPAPPANPQESFYYTIDKSELNRIFIGLAPVGVTPLIATHKLSETLRRVIAGYVEDPVTLVSKLGLTIEPDEVKRILHDYWLILQYHQKKQDIQKTTAFLEKTSNPGLKENEKFIVESLTGDKTLEEVRQVISRIEDEDNPLPEPNFLLATNMISHGVDINLFDLMIIYGVPQSTGEYIQASSRVGRLYPALVFMVFIINREKDHSYYKYFHIFNECKDILIEPVPINRWANNAIDRSLPGLLRGLLLLHYDYQIQEKYGKNIHMTRDLQHAIRSGWLDDPAKIAEILIDCYCARGKEGLVYQDKIQKYVTNYFKEFTDNVVSKNEFISMTAGDEPMLSLRDTDIPKEIQHLECAIPMKRGVIQLMYRYFPGAWIYFDKTRFEKEVAMVDFWDSRVKEDNINKKRLLRRIEKELAAFKDVRNISRPTLDEQEYLVLNPIKAIASTKNVAYYCVRCRRIYRKNNLTDGLCPDRTCRKKLEQIPFIYACKCGWTSPLSPSPCKVHGYQSLLYIGNRPGELKFRCSQCSYERDVFMHCPDCKKEILVPMPIGNPYSAIAKVTTMIDLIRTDKEAALENRDGLGMIYAGWLGRLKDKQEEADLFRAILSPDNEQGQILEKIEKTIKEYMEKYKLDEATARKICEDQSPINNEKLKRIKEINDWVSANVTILNYETQITNALGVLEYEALDSLEQNVGLDKADEAAKNMKVNGANIEYRKLANKYGFSNVITCSDAPMICCSYGLHRGSFKPEEVNLIGFPTDAEIKNRQELKGKKNIYAQKYETEAIIFELDRQRLVKWLLKNGIIDRQRDNVPDDLDDDMQLRLWLLNSIKPNLVSPYTVTTKEESLVTYYVYNLVHTLSHILIRNTEALCGLAKNSLSEYLILPVPAFMVYSHNLQDFPLGVFLNLFLNSFDEWLSLAKESAISCVNDPICINHINKEGDDTASCHNCLLLNEISCQHLNFNLDRKLLIGQLEGKDQVFWGYWQDWEMS